MAEIHTEPISPNRNQLAVIAEAIRSINRPHLESILIELGFTPATADHLMHGPADIDVLEPKMVYLKNQQIKTMAENIIPGLMEDIVNDNVSLFSYLLLSTQPQVLAYIVHKYKCYYKITDPQFFAHWYRNGGTTETSKGRVVPNYTNKIVLSSSMDLSELRYHIGQAAKYGHLNMVLGGLNIYPKRFPGKFSGGMGLMILQAAANTNQTQVFLEAFGRFKRVHDKYEIGYLIQFSLHGNRQMVDFLIEKGVSLLGLRGAAGAGDIELVRRFIDHVGRLDPYINKAFHYTSAMILAIKHGHIDIFELLFESCQTRSGNILTAEDVESLIKTSIQAGQQEIFKLVINLPYERSGNFYIIDWIIAHDRVEFLELDKDLSQRFDQYVRNAHPYRMWSLGYKIASAVVNHCHFSIDYQDLFRMLMHADVHDQSLIILFLTRVPMSASVEFYHNLAHRISHIYNLEPAIIRRIAPMLDRLDLLLEDVNLTTLRYAAETNDPRVCNYVLCQLFPISNRKGADSIFDYIFGISIPVNQETCSVIISRAHYKDSPYLVRLLRAGPDIQDLGKLPAMAMQWMDRPLLQAIEASSASRGNFNGLLELAATRGELHYVIFAISRGADTIKAAKNAARKHGQLHVWEYLEQQWPSVRTTLNT